MNITQREYPAVKFEMIQRVHPSFTTAARFFNKVLFFYTITGAGCVNVAFMQPKTAFCEIQGDRTRVPFYNLTRVYGQYHILCRIPKMIQWGYSQQNLTVSKRLAMSDAAMQYLIQTKQVNITTR
jgi:hypothetical protein